MIIIVEKYDYQCDHQFGPLKWELVLCLAATWLLVILSLFKACFLKSCHFLILNERIIIFTIKLLQRWSHPYHLCCWPSKLSLSNNF